MIILCSLLSAIALAAAPIRVLVLTGRTDLPYHDWRISTPFIRSMLNNSGRFDVRVIEELRGLSAATLAPYDVLVLNYNGPRWSTETEQAVEQFLSSGKGMIAFHGVSYGPFYGQQLTGTRRMEGEPWAAYRSMMGSTWKLENIGHSQRHVFAVKWVDSEHPIRRGLPPAFLADDELYHKMELAPEAHILATAYSDPKVRGTGKDEPVIWTVPFGRGRVVHMTLGHDLAALSQPGFISAFVRGTEWAATGDVRK